MQISLKSLPIFFLFFFYAWAMMVEHGVLFGIHLTAIAFSFFVLCTPFASYFYIIGLLPGATKNDVGMLRVVLIWILSLVVNVFTIFLAQSIYQRAFISKVLYTILIDAQMSAPVLSFSGGLLVYHWFVSTFESKIIRIWFHTIGVGFSLLVFYFGSAVLHDNVVLYMANMSSGNY